MSTEPTKTRRRRAPSERLDDILADLGRLNPDALFKLGQNFAIKSPLSAELLRKGLDSGGTLAVPEPPPQSFTKVRFSNPSAVEPIQA